MVEKLDSKYVKERTLKFLDEKGPSLPIPIAKHLGINTLFASAFLSEMAEEGIIKISHMKVGGSPLYYSPKTVQMLENFMNYLGAKEREACLLLKESGILKDEAQTPVIRVALRSVKDFAIPFKKEDKIYWRYFTFSEEQTIDKLKEPEIKTEGSLEDNKDKSEESEKPEEKKEKTEEESRKEAEIEKRAEQRLKEQEHEKAELEGINRQLEEKRKELEKLNKQLEAVVKEKKKSKKPAPGKALVKKKPKPADESFLNEVKILLSKKSIEILNVESFDKKHVFAKIVISGAEHLLAAYDKRKIEEIDILKTYKKASSMGLPYYIIARGEASKKTKESIDAHKKLASILLLEEKPEKTGKESEELEKASEEEPAEENEEQ